MSKSSKGSQFERDIAKQLSLWWTENKKDDVFYRILGSGGRATNRGKKGKKTAGGTGDICATDPIGKPLMDLLTIELKRGYSKFSIIDLLDCSEDSAQQVFEEWYEQVYTSQKLAGTPYWMIICKRNRREALCFIPRNLQSKLEEMGGWDHMTILQPFLNLDCWIRLSNKKKVKEDIAGMHLAQFLQISPIIIQRLVAQLRKNK